MGTQDRRAVAVQGAPRQGDRPRPKITNDKDIGEYARKVAHTVYHPQERAGWDPPPMHGGKGKDNSVVVDEKDLRIVGLNGVQGVRCKCPPHAAHHHPMLTILMVAERAAEIIRDDAWHNGLRKAY